MEKIQELNVSGVRGYEKDGTVYLRVQDVSIGLGFTQTTRNGNKIIRWERVKRYLKEVDAPTCGCGNDVPEFIPENVFYRLAMKAKNELAKEFQKKVADEIIPSIRRYGAYMTDQTLEKALLSPDFLIELATRLKQEKEKNRELIEENERMLPKAIFADAVSTSQTSILIGDLAKLIKQNGIDIGQKRLFAWLRDNGYLIRRNGSDYNMPTQRSMEQGLFEIKESTTNNPDGSVRINRTTKVTGKGQIYFVNKFVSALELKRSEG